VLGPARLTGGDGAGGLAARLERWAAEARVDEAARARSREWWLRRQAEEESTVTGVLADLREAGVAVTVHTRTGGRHSGVVRALGADFVALAVAATGQDVVVALAALSSVRTPPGVPLVTGDRAVVATPHLVDVVAHLASEREQVRIVTGGGEAVTGVVRWVGGDVAVVRGVGDPPSVTYVPLSAIAELVVG
jgi:hypothetical protein